MRPPPRGTRITCLTLCRSPGAVVVANSTRRRISRSTTRISTIANVAPRHRRFSTEREPRGRAHVARPSGPGRTFPHRDIPLNCCAPGRFPERPSPRQATDSRPAPPVPSARGHVEHHRADPQCLLGHGVEVLVACRVFGVGRPDGLLEDGGVAGQPLQRPGQAGRGRVVAATINVISCSRSSRSVRLRPSSSVARTSIANTSVRAAGAGRSDDRRFRHGVIVGFLDALPQHPLWVAVVEAQGDRSHRHPLAAVTSAG